MNKNFIQQSVDKIYMKVYPVDTVNKICGGSGGEGISGKEKLSDGYYSKEEYKTFSKDKKSNLWEFCKKRKAAYHPSDSRSKVRISSLEYNI